MKNSEKSAFGYSVPGSEKEGWLPLQVQGLSKREYFAGIALQGILSNSDSMREATKMFNKANPTGDEKDWGQAVGKLALLYADGILKELDK